MTLAYLSKRRLAAALFGVLVVLLALLVAIRNDMVQADKAFVELSRLPRQS
mgnify:CR=1 FL=1